MDRPLASKYHSEYKNTNAYSSITILIFYIILYQHCPDEVDWVSRKDLICRKGYHDQDTPA